MFDHRIRPLIDPILDRAARVVANAGLTADAVTLAGCVSGLLAAIAVYLGAWAVAFGLFLAGRALDGLDGAVARITGVTDRGGFLDIACDFLVYAAIPLAFACNNPDVNALAAATLLATFLVNGIAFLAFALMAERRKLTTEVQGKKSLYYSAGLAEGAETIAVFSVMMLWPQVFATLAYGFAALVAVSGLSRLVLGWKSLA